MKHADKYKAQIGGRLRMTIEALNLQQTQASEVMGVSPGRLNNWLRGDNYPEPYALQLFCDRYNITMDWIYREKLTVAMDQKLQDTLWAAAKAEREQTSDSSLL